MTRRSSTPSIALDDVLMFAACVRGFRDTPPGTLDETIGCDRKALFAHAIVVLAERLGIARDYDSDSEVVTQAASYLGED